MKTKLLKLSLAIFAFAVTTNGSAQTDGTLTMTYTQALPTSPASPEFAVNGTATANIYAVWIENAAGTFIKTKYRFALSEKDHLPTWLVKSGGTAPTGTAKGNCLQAACNTTDAVTGATRSSSTLPTSYGNKTVTWDGKNVAGAVNGTTVADGVYKVWIESSWVDSGNNNHQTINSFSFTKGTVADHQVPANTTYFTNIVLDWVPTPMATNAFSSDNLSANVYPNPSNGVFNIDFNTDVNHVKVINLLGQKVIDENCVQTNGTSKSIDLSSFENGIYVISISNENGKSSNYKVILNK
jgi:Secretion system C-terminal sorting domain